VCAIRASLALPLVGNKNQFATNGSAGEVTEWPLDGGCEVGVFAAEALHHGEDKFFNLLGLYLGLGEELGRAEAQLGHLIL
jgi:hypothetical protein